MPNTTSPNTAMKPSALRAATIQNSRAWLPNAGFFLSKDSSEEIRRRGIGSSLITSAARKQSDREGLGRPVSYEECLDVGTGIKRPGSAEFSNSDASVIAPARIGGSCSRFTMPSNHSYARLTSTFFPVPERRIPTTRSQENGPSVSSSEALNAGAVHVTRRHAGQ
jgi:hypothetical protein